MLPALARIEAASFFEIAGGTRKFKKDTAQSRIKLLKIHML